MSRLEGKVALVTGAARGQGRSHALRFAEEGADVIAVDMCADIAGLAYPMGTRQELKHTCELVEAVGRRAVMGIVDVRDFLALDDTVRQAVTELGGLDIAIANAGIGSLAHDAHAIPESVWQEMIDINLTGVWHTAKAAAPHLIATGSGASLILTSSAAGLKAYPGIAHYVAAKHAVVGLMKTMAIELGSHGVRVNSVHPTQVDTPMIMNDGTYRLFVPDADHPTREDFAPVSQAMHALPIPWVDPVDVSNAVVWLCSDEARRITGVALPVDAGVLLK